MIALSFRAELTLKELLLSNAVLSEAQVVAGKRIRYLSLKHRNPDADENRCMDQIADAPVAKPHTHEAGISTAKTLLITVGGLLLLWSLGLAVAVALDAR